MGVLREYLCMAHGRFEGTEPVCPAGCTTVEQRHFTAPGIRSNRTSYTDRMFATIAKDYGLTDMNTHGGTTAARVHSPATQRALEMQEKLRAKFAPMPAKGGAPAALAELGAQPSNAVNEAKESGVLTPPKIIYTRDPENLKIS